MSDDLLLFAEAILKCAVLCGFLPALLFFWGWEKWASRKEKNKQADVIEFPSSEERKAA